MIAIVAAIRLNRRASARTAAGGLRWRSDRHARRRADRRRQARAAQQAALARAKRRRTITQLAIVGGVAVVVIAIIATAVVLGTRGKTAAAGAGPSASATTTVDGTSVPFAIGGTGDTATGVRVGAADAKVTMDLWVDYSCPHCQEFEADEQRRDQPAWWPPASSP